MTFLASELLSEYLSKTTIHGLSYFGDRQRHWVERSFWIVTFIISMAGCFFMVHKTYLKWQQSPLIVTQDNKFTPVSEIPFPAVTICPSTKIAETNTNLTRTYDILQLFLNKMKSLNEIVLLNDDDKAALNITDEDVTILIASSLVCVGSFFAEPHVNSLPIDLNHSEIESFFKVHRPFWNRTFHDYYLKGKTGGGRLPWVLTEEGICYTFNSQGNFQIFKQESIASDFRPYEIDGFGSGWNAEDGYESKETFPMRAFRSQPGDALTLYLRQHPGGPGNCPYDNSRMKVIIHSPGEFPRATRNFISIPLKHEVSITVKPVMMTSTHDLFGYSTEARQCYFNGERSLTFFKFYTLRNCEHECFTNFTLAICGCVKLSMPRDDNTTLCTPKNYDCLYNSDYFYRLSRIEGLAKYFDDIRIDFKLNLDQMKLLMRPCGCLPSCVSLDYELTVTQSEIAFEEESDDDLNLKNSVLNIYFKDESFLKLKRSELYGWSDFIANCGGLLGLFMGVSILSLIEIIYYASLRLLCSIRSRKHKITDEVTMIQSTKNIDCRIVLEPEFIEWNKF